MIEKLRVKGFKRFVDQTFEFRPLTILAGWNGAGKSSVIHALLLACQAARNKTRVVQLNGYFNLELGTFEDVLNRETTGAFSVQIEEDNRESNYEFDQDQSGLQRPYAHVRSGGINPSVFDESGRSLQYLSAERFGPRVTLLHQSAPQELLEVGTQGEFAAQVLDSLATLQVDYRRRCAAPEPDVPALLKAETELWLSRITRPIQIDTETFAGTLVAAIKFRVEDTWLKPTNMGFGITYSLPIILAAMSAKLGGLVIVENPEAHLHPAGQTQMGIFLAQMAAAGIQIMVETHSDHILNGVRRAIGEIKVLRSDASIVHFFDADNSNPQSLFFTDNGGISDWPAGFFDQYQIDVAALSRVRRSR
jgi:predicted ATPase